MLARGRVLRPGRTVIVSAGDVHAVIGGEQRLVATMLETMATVGGESPRHVAKGSALTTAHDHVMRAHRSRGSWRRARPWCVGRGGKLRQQLQQLLGG